MKRCSWVKPNSELYIKYHDTEWGEKARGAFARGCQLFRSMRNSDNLNSFCKKYRFTGTHSI